MPDTVRVTRGTPLAQSPSLNANWVNGVSEMLSWFNRMKASGESAGGDIGALESTSGVVKVKNLTGADLLRGNYVQLGDYLLDDIDHRKHWYEGNLYDAGESGRIAILEKAVKSSDTTCYRARIIGKCTARVDVIDVDHRFAAPDDGESLLKSAASGSIEILSTNKISGTGEQELAVLMGGGGGGGSETIQIARVLVKITKATSNLVADWGAGAVQYVDSTTGELVADSYVTVSNRWPIEYAVDSMVKIGETAGDVEGMCGPAPADFWQET